MGDRLLFDWRILPCLRHTIACQCDSLSQCFHQPLASAAAAQQFLTSQSLTVHSTEHSANSIQLPWQRHHSVQHVAQEAPRVITYWLLLALLAHLLRGINSVVPPVQSSMPVVDTFRLDYASVHMPKGPGLNATLHRLTGYHFEHK